LCPFQEPHLEEKTPGKEKDRERLRGHFYQNFQTKKMIFQGEKRVRILARKDGANQIIGPKGASHLTSVAVD